MPGLSKYEPNISKIDCLSRSGMGLVVTRFGSTSRLDRHSPAMMRITIYRQAPLSEAGSPYRPSIIVDRTIHNCIISFRESTISPYRLYSV